MANVNCIIKTSPPIFALFTKPSPPMQSLTTIKPRDRDCCSMLSRLKTETQVLKETRNFARAESLQNEAEKVRYERLKKLTDTEEARQQFERDCLTQAQRIAMEFEQRMWAENEALLQKEIEDSVLQLQEDQEIELRRLESNLSKEAPKAYFSSKVLNLRKEVDTLFKLKEYNRAKEVTLLADQEEKAFLSKLEKERIRKADIERKKLYDKHDKEINALEHRNYLKFCEFWAARNAALTATAQRGKNLKQDMDSAHKEEYLNLRARCVDREFVLNRKSYERDSATFRGSAFLKLARTNLKSTEEQLDCK